MKEGEEEREEERGRRRGRVGLIRRKGGGIREGCGRMRGRRVREIMDGERKGGR